MKAPTLFLSTLLAGTTFVIGAATIDPAETITEVKARWYKNLPGEKFDFNNSPDDYKEVLYGVTYKWITKHLSWDDAAGRLIAL